MSAARVSVVVASFRERSALERTLRALIPQCQASGARVVIARRSDGSPEPWLPKESALLTIVPCPVGDCLPRIRGRGLLAAESGWVLLTEDNCAPDPGWLAAIEAALNDRDSVVAGTMAPPPSGTALDLGAHFAEYGFFGPGRRAAAGTLATGANVAYRADLVPRVARWALEGAWEDVIHDRLLAGGARFSHAPSAVVRPHPGHKVSDFLKDRYVHGREFARVRSATLSGIERGGRCLGCAILPLILAGRIWRSSGRYQPRQFLRGLPLTLGFLAAWSAGEAVGYARGQIRRD